MENAKNTKIAFFFGAGAEVDFGLPSGVQYTLDTILSRRSGMLDALKDFYSDKLGDYASKYFQWFLFAKNSHTFREIVKRACQSIDISAVDLDAESKQVVDCFDYDKNNENAKRTFYEQVEKVHDYVLLDLDKPNDNKRPQQLPEAKASNKYSYLMNNFTYYGSIEKDFSTIINPKSAGIKRFWRLINYFWSAFFTILFPVLDLSKKYDDTQEYKNKYGYILSRLQEVINYIYSTEYKEEIGETYEKSFYHRLSEAFPESIAATTNYTPFLEFSAFRKKIFLAGKLSQFEIPDELRIVDLKESQDIVNKMIFPFLLTQAPVKPIINGTQLEEYNAFIDFLKDLRTLVIIGYGMNENDDHINALLRDFLTRSSDKKIVYCKFMKDGEIFDMTKSVDEVAQRLRISDEVVKRQIYVIPHHGEPENIVEKLKEIKL